MTPPVAPLREAALRLQRGFPAQRTGSPMPYAPCPIPQVGGQKFIPPLAGSVFPADFL